MSQPRCVLEVQDSHGALVARARIESLPATIGRGYGCDIIVDDPYLDAVHVRIVEDGDGLAAEDAGSVNGLRANKSNERVTRVPLVRGTVLHAGRTTITYLDPSEAMPPARRDRPAAWNAPLATSSRLNSPIARAGVVIACLAIVAVHKSETFFDRGPASKTIAEVFVVLFMMTVWAGVWSGIARLARHPALFSYHLAITSAASAALVTAYYVWTWFEFLWPAGFASVPFALLCCAILVAAVYAQLGLASSLRRWWRWGLSIAIPVAAIALLLVIVEDSDSGFSVKMQYDDQLKPVPVQLVPAISPAEFSKGLTELKEEVAKELKDEEKKKK